MKVDVVNAGLLTTVQDVGRHGHAALGVGHAGPMDAALLRLAQALVGNADGDAALEITLTGPRLRFPVDSCVALTGDLRNIRINDVPADSWRPLFVPAGSVLDCGRLDRGSRGYLAIAGGIEVAAVLGSRSVDVNAGIGPCGGRALQSGDHLPVRSMPAPTPFRANWSLDPAPWFDDDPGQPIHYIPGRHHEALDDASQRALERDEFRIAAASNRVGLRLDGPDLRLRTPLELISEPVGFGAIQLPAGGQAIVLMAEHPTTGGYPCVGQVAAIDHGRLAQRRLGAPVRFAAITLQQAQSRYLAQQRQLDMLVAAIHERIRP